jgi:hypothetical protein
MLMKVVGVIGTTALFFLLGITVPTLAQEEHQPEAKPAQHQEEAKPPKQQEQAEPEKQQEAAKPAKQKNQTKSAKQEPQAKPVQHEQQAKPAKQENQAKSAKQEQQAKPAQHEAQAKPVKQENQATVAKQQSQSKQAKQEEHGNASGQQHAQRTPAEEQRQRAVPALRLSARGEGRIPDDRFRSNFGEAHVFVINEPVMVGGYSRFQYGGYSFGFIEPWPVEWYYTDDVYVDFIDGGYYLYNPYYPGSRVSISVVI